MTSGRGVDLALNSLAEEKLQAALSVVASGGRFLEIGKFDLFNNTALGMEVFLRNISFHGILLDALFFDSEAALQEKRELVQLVATGIETRVIQPLPCTIFDLNEVEPAFRFMASGKHIGKVVIRVRDEESENAPLLKVIPRSYFSAEKTYIIFGGLGGFGLEITSWIISRGARTVAIVSRSGITTGYQALQVQRWRNNGVNVILSTDDMCKASNVESLLQRCAKHGPVGGIFNLAMVMF